MLTLVIMTAGALVSREYPQAGFVMSLCGMVFYLCADIPGIVKHIRSSGKADTYVKVKVFLWLLFLFVTLGAVFGKAVSYFYVLVLLGVDYILAVRSRDNEKGD